jgi:electron transfer flavoprotein beta subunit
MKIAVLLRRRRDRPDGALPGADRLADRLLGRCEEAALSAALSLRGADGELVAVTAGPAERETPVLEEALRVGADRAIRIWDPVLDGVDYYGIARVLAASIKKQGFDLVVCGERSEDECQGAVGPAVAELLGVTHLTAAVDLAADGKSVLVTRRDAGSVRTLRVPLPTLVSVTRFVEPDRPAGGGSSGPPVVPGVGARPERPSTKSTIETMDLAAVGITAAELKHRDRCVGRAHAVRVARNATLVGVRDLVERLRDERLLE